MIKELTTIDIQPLLDCYTQLESQIVWTEYGHKGKQAGLQHKEGEDPWTSAVGRSRGQELTYTQLNMFFKDTLFDRIINNYNLKRTRLMWVNPMACYSMHKDETARIHIPLITNLECYFVFKDSHPVHLGIGKIWLTDTRKLHTFMNCSDQPRLHLVGIVEN